MSSSTVALTELAQAEEAVQDLSDALTSAQGEVETLEASLQDLDAKLTDEQQRSEALENSLSEAESTLNTEQEQRAAAEAQLTEAQAEAQALEAQVEALQQSSDSDSNSNSGTDPRASELSEELTAERATREAAEAEVEALNQALEQVTRAGGTEEATTHALSEAVSKLAVKEAELAQAEAIVNVRESGEARLEFVVQSLGQQLDDARSELDSRAGRYRVGRMSATFKVVPTADGVMRFPDPSTVSDASSLSELVIELNEGVPTTKGHAAEGPTVPTVLGLTRVAVERILRAAGLRWAFVSEAVEDAASVGRAVRQVPAAGEAATPGAVVAVYLGKRIEAASTSVATTRA